MDAGPSDARNRWLVVASGSSSCSPAATRARKLSTLLSNTFTRPGHRLRAGPRRSSSSTSATAATARSRSSSRCRTRATRRCVARLQARRRRARRAACRRGEATAARRRAATRRLRRHRLDARPRQGEGLHATSSCARCRQAAGVDARTSPAQAAIQHDLDPIFNEDLKKGELDRDPDRAARPAARVRALGRGHDPVHLRGVHDHRHARDRLRLRAPHRRRRRT